ncbi:MAG TPA: malectin domain-containing carbohydrate-binding protein [Candidatus Hydrogenedentes bacterium]|nr:malectin domain-containing carbohydrate-binding protein [Candidatus Hydrogenedentota bacterium]HPG69490.1 malectin domain-containing carbohydrate-binding protein [Candidatus Hydrogenedentota bacterium]
MMDTHGIRMLWLWAGLLAVAVGASAAPGPVIVCDADASFVEQLAAKEVRRYVYVRTGEFLPIVTAEEETVEAAIVVARTGRASAHGIAPTGAGDQAYVLKPVAADGLRRLYIVGGDVGVLYGAYRFAEFLGMRFYLDGDVAPDARASFDLPDVAEDAAPLFALRGIQPFHDFPEGPDWWNPDDYLAIVGQLPKLRMNFLGLHTYPERRPNAEPTTWIGLAEDVGDDGSVKFAYPAIYYNTVLPVSWGLRPMKTSDYHCGSSLLFDRDGYGSEIMRDLEPMPDAAEDCVKVFARTAEMFDRVFGLAGQFGIKTCLGTETPLLVPERVIGRLDPGAARAFRALGGKTPSFTQAIDGTEDDPLYQTVRYDLQGYTVAVANGTYTVTLQFCEPAHSGPGARVFGVALEGKPVIKSLDIFAKVGKDRALDYTFEGVAVADGELNIDFVCETEYPCIAAFAVVSNGFQCKVNCGGPAYGDYAADTDSGTATPEQVRALYEGMFTRIMRAHPLDYYWLWTPEGWTWEGTTEVQAQRTIDDIRTAYDAIKAVGAPFHLATCGWVLGPQYDRALFDKVLPKDVPVSCISRGVGHEPVEPGFAEVQGRPKWAIPWLEDDPAMTSPQLWVGRMRRDAYDALRYGCTGLMGIHWRTRILGPNVSALAGAAWDQSSWAQRPPAEGADAGWPVGDFYADWARHLFGTEAARDIAAIFSRIDGHLPRPSDWIGGPGGYAPDERPWDEVAGEYAFVDELAALRTKVKGKGNLARFDYWMANFRFLRATGRMRCVWAAYNKALGEVKAVSDKKVRQQRAREELVPLRQQLVAVVDEAYRNQLEAVNTSGAMGTIANLEQHTFPDLLDAPAKELVELTGGDLPEDAYLTEDYDCAARVFVPTVRGSVEPGERLTIKVVFLDAEGPQEAKLFWRSLGEVRFEDVPLTHEARGVYAVAISPTEDFEYYVRVITSEDKSVFWPATAPELNQTVIVLPATA